jgi:hypothetical protein
LSHLDAEAYAEIGWRYELSFDRVVCSYLTDDVWQTLRDSWRHVADLHRDRPFGRLPDRVDARDLSCARMTSFDDLWPHS